MVKPWDVGFFSTSTLWWEKFGRWVSRKLLMPPFTQAHCQAWQTPLFQCFTSSVAWFVQLSPQPSHLLVYSSLAIPALQWQNSQFCPALSYFHICHRVLTVRSFLSFPLQKQVMLQQGKCSTSVWRSASCHKGNNRGHKAAPKAPVQQSISDQQSI